MWISLGYLPVPPSLPWGLMVQSGLAHLSLPVGGTGVMVVPEGSLQEVLPTPGCLHPSTVQMCARTQSPKPPHTHTHHALPTVYGFHIHQRAVWQPYSLTQSIPCPTPTGTHTSEHTAGVRTCHVHPITHKPRPIRPPRCIGGSILSLWTT